METKQIVNDIKENFLYELTHIPYHVHGQITYFADWYIEDILKKSIERVEKLPSTKKEVMKNKITTEIVILETTINLLEKFLYDIKNNREIVEDFGILDFKEDNSKLVKNTKNLIKDCKQVLAERIEGRR